MKNSIFAKAEDDSPLYVLQQSAITQPITHESGPMATGRLGQASFVRWSNPKFLASSELLLLTSFFFILSDGNKFQRRQSDKVKIPGSGVGSHS